MFKLRGKKSKQTKVVSVCEKSLNNASEISELFTRWRVQEAEGEEKRGKKKVLKIDKKQKEGRKREPFQYPVETTVTE